MHAGLPRAAQGAPFLPGPTFAAPYHLSGDPAEAEFTYGRYGNPAWSAYERAIGELEGGEAVVFGSGMGAVATVLLALLEAGDSVVLPADGYYTVRTLGAELLPFEVREVPSDTAAYLNAAEGARVVWIETPSNPGLAVVDVERVAGATGATVVVDNTLATALGQRPLELGADFSVVSASKATTGHSDLVLGYVAGRDVEAVRAARNKLGTVAGPFEVWLAHRSLATLDVRLERQCANALRLAEALAAHVPVRYPGLPGDPAHELAARQMDRFGPVLGFTLPDEDAAAAFFARSELTTEATSFGGVHTVAERRARWGSDAVGEGFVRLSAGCEAPEDLVADVVHAVTRALGRD